jgi:hypothetical protein
MNQFLALALADQLTGLPAMYRQDAKWTLTLNKEDNSFRAILHEKTAEDEFVATPEDNETPCFLICGPRATLKPRCESIEVANRALVTRYGTMLEVSESLHTHEWGLIASLAGGEIPLKHRAIRNPQANVRNPVKFNKEVFEAGLATQPYDKGLERFDGKYDPSQPISAVIAIEPGCHHDHGTAIFFQQDKRRCLLVETLFGLTDDEALWFTLQSWAKF